jgi:hypothetical protein
LAAAAEQRIAIPGAVAFHAAYELEDVFIVARLYEQMHVIRYDDH